MLEHFLPRIFPTASRLRHHDYVALRTWVDLDADAEMIAELHKPPPAANSNRDGSVDQIQPLSLKTGHY
jgi:hypothetical protein